jgi:hypothetical protein
VHASLLFLPCAQARLHHLCVVSFTSHPSSYNLPDYVSTLSGLLFLVPLLITFQQVVDPSVAV